MSLKFQLNNLDGLDESVAALYTKHDDGTYYLDVTGAVAKSKVDEFRNKNIELMRTVEDTQNKYKDIDIDKYNELVDKANKEAGKELIPASKMDEMLNERVRTMQQEHQTVVDELNNKLGTTQSQLDTLVIDSAVRREATLHGVLDSAVDDVLLRARSIYKTVDGKATPYDSDGKVIFGKNGSDPQPIGEWIDSLSKSAGHLFKGSSGSGAQTVRTGGGNVDPSKMSATEKIKAGLEESA